MMISNHCGVRLSLPLQSATLPQEKTHLQRQITATDRQIEQVVWTIINPLKRTLKELDFIKEAI